MDTEKTLVTVDEMSGSQVGRAGRGRFPVRSARRSTPHRAASPSPTIRKLLLNTVHYSPPQSIKYTTSKRIEYALYT